MHIRPLVLCLVLMSGVDCLSPSREECTREDNRCSGGLALNCDVGSDEAGRYALIRTQDCKSPDLCKADTLGPQGLVAYCVLEPDPNPACNQAPWHETGSYPWTRGCASTTDLVRCRSGYVMEHDLCESCSAGVCDGGASSPCSATKPCAPGLQCAETSPGSGTRCAYPCDCADFEICPACDALGIWVNGRRCYRGWCA